MYLPYGRSVWTVMLLFGRCLDERSFYFAVAVGTVIVLLFWHGVEEELIAIPFARWVQYWDSYLDILILNRLLIRLNVMVADFVLVIASLPALIPKHMRLIIPVVLLVWIV